MEWWGWLLTAAGALATIWKAVEIVSNWTKPIREHTKKVKDLEVQNKRDLQRFDQIDDQLRQMKNANQAVYKALFQMMNHMIDGNSIEKMKLARDELRTYIIEH